MADGFSIDISGTDDVLKAMGKMPRATQKKILRPGLRKGGKIIQKQAIENLKAIVSEEATGFLAKNVVVRAKRTRRDEVGVAVSIRGNVVNPVNGERPGLYGSVLEHGKEDQEARPWLRPAHRQKGPQAVSALIETGRQKLAETVEDARRR